MPATSDGLLYDDIRLDVTVGPGFDLADARLNELAAKVQSLQKLGVIRIGVDSTGINKAIADAERLRGVLGNIPPAMTGSGIVGTSRVAGSAGPSTNLGMIDPRRLRAAIHPALRAEINTIKTNAVRDFKKLPEDILVAGVPDEAAVRAWRDRYLARMRPLIAAKRGTYGWLRGEQEEILAGAPATPIYRTPSNQWYRAAGGGAGMPPAGGGGVGGGGIPPGYRMGPFPPGWGAGGGKPTMPSGGWGAGVDKNYATQALAAAAAQDRLNKAIAQGKAVFGPFSNMMGQVFRNVGKVAMWGVATGAIYGLIHAFKSMLDIVIQVDHAMADIRKVYQHAPGDIKPLRDSLISLTMELGGNTTQVMEAATAWARMGYDRKEITSLMRTSMLAMNIAELSAADATRYLTSAMIQFNIPATGSLGILDSWNELSNRTLATTGDLGESVSITGKTFQQMGDSIDYVNGLTATLVETMGKSGKEVGTALRTIGTYIYRPRTTKTLETVAGVSPYRDKTLPGETTGEVDISKMKNVKEDLKPVSEILEEVALRWDKLKTSEQTTVAMAVAGVRRYNYFMNIMDNYDKVIENTILSMTGMGSAERENAIYMDTLQKKVELLRAAFVGLYTKAGDSGIAGIFKSLITILTKFITVLGRVNLVIPAIATGIILLLPKLKVFATTITRIITAMTDSELKTRGFGKSLKGLISPMVGVQIGIMAAAAAFTYLASQADKVEQAYQRLIEKSNEYVGNLYETRDKAMSTAKTLMDMSRLEAMVKEKYLKEGATAEERAKGLKLLSTIKGGKESTYEYISKEAQKRGYGVVTPEAINTYLQAHPERADEVSNIIGENVVKDIDTYIDITLTNLRDEHDRISKMAEGPAKIAAMEEFNKNYEKYAPELGGFSATAGKAFGQTMKDLSDPFTSDKGWFAEGLRLEGRVVADTVKDAVDVYTSGGKAKTRGKSRIIETEFNKIGNVIDTSIDDATAARAEDAKKQVEKMIDESGIDEPLAENDTGTSKVAIDSLQEFLNDLNDRVVAASARVDAAKYFIEKYKIELEKLNMTYGDTVAAHEEYWNTMDKLSTANNELIKAEEDKGQVLSDNLAAIEIQGPALAKNKEDTRKLADTMRDYTASIRDNTLAVLKDELVSREYYENNLSALQTQAELEDYLAAGRRELARDAVLGESTGAKHFDDLNYIMGKTNDQVDRMNRSLEGSNISYFNINELSSIYLMNQTELNALLDQHNIKEWQRKDIMEYIKDAYESQIEYAKELNAQYKEMANSMQSMVDDGLWGIITGEQTALDLAKQIGLEYGRIATQTLTQPFTERFAAGLGGAAYMIKTGRMLPGGASLGLENAMVTDGAVHVRDDRLAGIVASGGGQGIGGAAAGAMGMAAYGGARGQGIGRSGGSIYGGTFGQMMPYIGGAISGGLMGSGGGVAGSMFGAGAGVLGTYLSTLGPIGALAGAGVTMLGFLGNLFGRHGRHAEEDPYSRSQANGMGERSVSIGSAGAVYNYVYLTVSYESQSDAENAARLADLIEDAVSSRGYQTTGNARQTAV